MSTGKMHQYQVDLAVELAPPASREFILKHMDFARLGSGWHDLTASPDGVTDRDHMRAQWAKRNIACADDLLEWGFADEIAYVRKHFVYAPEWYVRQMRRAMAEGNEAKAAIVWGILMHSCEYLTASKGSGMFMHDLPEDVAWGERWLVNGHPFQDEFAYEHMDGTFDRQKILAGLRSRIEPSEETTCREVYRQMLRTHFTTFFPAELQWLMDYEAEGMPACWGRYEALCFDELAATFRVALAALDDVLGDRPDECDEADVLFLLRDDLWRRDRIEGRVDPAHRGIEALRYVTGAIKLGLSFHLWSGEGRPDLSGYRAVVAVCGEPLRDEEEFEQTMAAAPNAIVIHRKEGEPNSMQPVFDALREVLGSARIPADAHCTPEATVELLRRIAERRQPRLCSVVDEGDGDGRDLRTVCQLAASPNCGKLECRRWDDKLREDFAECLEVDPERNRWTVHAPCHATLLLSRTLPLPSSARVFLRMWTWIERSIAVGMRVECACKGERRLLMRMHVTHAESEKLLLDLTEFAGESVELRFLWDAGYDFGYQDRDTLVIDRPEIVAGDGAA